MSTTTEADVLIIGAGITGLFIAGALGRAGKKVILLEARDRTGGRIHTVQDAAFDMPVEGGAEFIHGDLRLTQQLLKKAGIDYYTVKGDFWQHLNGRLEPQEDYIEQQGELIKCLKTLEQDMNVKDFLATFFPGEEYADLRRSLTSFVEGYDAADAAQASCFALLQELLGEEGEQKRIKGGYGQLVNHLAGECLRAGCLIQLSTIVSSIEWQPGQVTVTTNRNEIYTGSKVIITVPVGVLQAPAGQTGHINISPLPARTYEAIHALGTTGVIKAVLQFKEAFWKTAPVTANSKPAKHIGFLFGDTTFPTWWTQLPEDNAVITGWMAGTAAVRLKDATDTTLLQAAIQSLAHLFSTATNTLESMLVAGHVFNWTTDPFTRGAYGYEKVTSKNAKRILNQPLDNTLYFAGEALHEGPERGTVEAALLSGSKIIEQLCPPSQP